MCVGVAIKVTLTRVGLVSITEQRTDTDCFTDCACVTHRHTDNTHRITLSVVTDNKLCASLRSRKVGRPVRILEARRAGTCWTYMARHDGSKCTSERTEKSIREKTPTYKTLDIVVDWTDCSGTGGVGADRMQSATEPRNLRQ